MEILLILCLFFCIGFLISCGSSRNKYGYDELPDPISLENKTPTGKETDESPDS